MRDLKPPTKKSRVSHPSAQTATSVSAEMTSLGNHALNASEVPSTAAVPTATLASGELRAQAQPQLPALYRVFGTSSLSDTLPAQLRRAGAEPLSHTPAQDQAASGLPEGLRSGLESLSGLSLAGVRVHRDSPEPSRLGALAFTRLPEIHLGPGQEEHLPHEGWHAVQQLKGQVRATTHASGTPINDDPRLEREADTYGARAARFDRVMPAQDQCPRSDGVLRETWRTHKASQPIQCSSRVSDEDAHERLEAARSDVERELRILCNDVRDVMDARRVVLERLANDTTPQSIEVTWGSHLVLNMAVAAIGMATAGIGGMIAGAISATASGLAKELLKSAVKDLIDTQLNTVLEDAIQDHLVDWRGAMTADPRKAFFRGPADAILTSRGGIERSYQDPAFIEQILSTAEPVQSVRSLQRGFRSSIDAARSEQYKHSLAGWMNLLAEADLNTAEGGSADVKNAGLLGEGGWEQLRRMTFAAAPRGVVRMRIRADDSDKNVDILETRVAGLNEDIVAAIRTIDASIGDLGLTLYLYGETYSHLPHNHGYVEIGKNAAGTVFAEAETYGETWLYYYGRGRKTPTDEDGYPYPVAGSDLTYGAQYLIEGYIEKLSFNRDLGWESNELHRNDGVIRHG